MTAAIDWAHTDKARHDREVKAQKLVAAARELGVPPTDLDLTALGRSRRREVRKLAGVDSASEESWNEVVQILAEHMPADMPPAATPSRSRLVRRCYVPSCDVEDDTVLLYPGGPFCDAHQPGVLLGHGRPPRPRAGTTLADLRAARPAVAVVLDERVAAAKGKAHTAEARARLAEHVHRRFVAAQAGPR